MLNGIIIIFTPANTKRAENILILNHVFIDQIELD